MGFIGGILRTIFSPDVEQASTQTPTITGRELVSSTTSEAPESAVMGDDKKNKKEHGLDSLLVQSEDLYKGGNN